MNPATKTSGVHQSAAHLRVVSDRRAGGTPGIQLSGVSKTYRSRDGDVPSLRPLDFHINAGEFFVDSNGSLYYFNGTAWTDGTGPQ